MVTSAGSLKRKDRTYEASYPPVRLRRADLVELIGLTQEHFEQYRIELDEFEIRDIQDIDQLVGVEGKVRTHSLVITSSRPKFQLSLRQSHARLFLADRRNTRLLGVTRLIEDILMRRRGVHNLFQFGWTAILTMFGVLIGIASLQIAQLIGQENIPAVVLISGSSVLVGYWMVTSILNLFRHTQIELTNPEGASGFISRHWDDFLVQIGPVLGSFLLSLLLTKVL